MANRVRITGKNTPSGVQSEGIDAQVSADGELYVAVKETVSQSSPTTVGNGGKAVTTAGTAEALGGDVTTKEIIVTAKDTNTGKVFIGGTGVSATSGMYIYPGQGERFSISNLNKIYIDVETDGEGVQYTYFA